VLWTKTIKNLKISKRYQSEEIGLKRYTNTIPNIAPSRWFWFN